MKIVIDTNVIISALLKDSVTRGILTDFRFIFLLPSFSLSEISKYKEEICKKAGITLQEFYELFERIMRNIQIINHDFYSAYIKEAEGLINDIEDVSFLALALSSNCLIWSDDKHFKQQKRIKILTTKEMIEFLIKK